MVDGKTTGFAILRFCHQDAFVSILPALLPSPEPAATASITRAEYTSAAPALTWMATPSASAISSAVAPCLGRRPHEWRCSRHIDASRKRRERSAHGSWHP